MKSKRLLLILGIILFALTTKAQIYYLKAPVIGTYTLSSPTIWSSSCGSGTTMVGAPTSNYDLIIDGSCLATGATTLNISNNNSCKSITFTNLTATKSLVLIGNGDLTVFGKFDNQTSFLTNNFVGNIIFTSATSATINNVFNGIPIKGCLAVNKPVTGTTITNFDAITMANQTPTLTTFYLQIALDQAAGSTVNFNGVVSFPNLFSYMSGIYALSGTVNFNADVIVPALSVFSPTSGIVTQVNVNKNSVIYRRVSNNRGGSMSINPSLPSSFQSSFNSYGAGNIKLAPRPYSHHWEKTIYSNSTNGGYYGFELTNTVNSVIYNFTDANIYTTGWRITSPATTSLTMANSKLFFTTLSGGDLGSYSTIAPAGKTYNYIELTSTSPWYLRVNNAGFVADSIILNQNSYLQNATTTSPLIINSLFRIDQGATLSSSSTSTINITSSAKLELLGNCNNYVNLAGSTTNPVGSNAQFLLAPTSTLTSNYVNITMFNITGSPPYNAGAGSNMQGVIGSSTGWTIGASTARALRWVGASGITLDWGNAANWQQIAGVGSFSASTFAAAPQCPPTLYDSIVFPVGSQININQALVQCYSMYWQGTGLLTSPTPTTTADYKRLDIFGGLYGNDFYSWDFNGDVYFRAWNNKNGITCGANTNFKRRVTFWASDVNGGWTVYKDSLRTPFDYTANNFGFSTTNLNLLYNPDDNFYTLNLYEGSLTLDAGVKIKTPNMAVGQANTMFSLLTGSSTHPNLGSLGMNRSLICSNTIVSSQKNTILITGAGPSRDFFPVYLVTPNFSNSVITYTNYLLGVPYVTNFNSPTASQNTFINAGTSTIKFTNTLTDSSFTSNGNIVYRPSAVFGGFNYNIIATAPNTYPKFYFANDNFNLINLGDAAELWNTRTTAGYIQKIIVNSLTKQTKIGQWNKNSGLANSYYMIDSALYKGDFLFKMNTQTNKLLKFYEGQTYDLTASTQSLIGSGRLDANANCVDGIIIQNGSFFSNTTFTQTVQNCAIASNTVLSAPSFSAINSSNLGSNIGWVFNSPPCRSLYWYDGIAGNSRANWGDPMHWSLSSGSLNPIGGNCPPGANDDIVFNNASFSGVDTVIMSSSGNTYPSTAIAHNISWLNTLPAVYKGDYSNLSDSASFKLQIFGSLTLNSNIVNNVDAAKYKGLIIFRGDNTNCGSIVNTPDIIHPNGYIFNRKLIFEADAPAHKQWKLASPLTALYNYRGAASDNSSFIFNAGILNTDGKTVSTDKMFSTSGKYRKLKLGSTQFKIMGYPTNVLSSSTPAYTWWVGGNTALFNIDRGTSVITFSNSAGGAIDFIGGGGKRYNDVIFYYDGGINLTARDTFHLVQFKGNTGRMGTVNTGTIKLSGGDYYVIDSLIADNISGSRLAIFSDDNVFGQAWLNRDANIYSNNKYNELFHLEAGKSYQFGATKIQFLSNMCATEIIGNAGAGNQINVNSTSTGVQAFIRKDSSIVCTDFIYMRDFWGIGNGVNTQDPGFCNIPTCDTLKESSIDGVTPQTPGSFSCSASYNFNDIATSGRARFQGGTNANYQGNDRGWETCPYPFVPKIDLTLPNTAICVGDSVLISFRLEGTPPYQNLTYVENTNSGASYPAINNNTVAVFGNLIAGGVSPSYSVSPGIKSGDILGPQTPSLSTTTFGSSTNPYFYSYWVKPSVTTRYTLGSISINRCFNNVSAAGTGTFIVTVNPHPSSLSTISNPTAFCSGSLPTISFTSSATAGNTYTLYPTSSGTSGGSVMTSYTVSGPATNGSVTVSASTYTTGSSSTTYTLYSEATYSQGCLSLSRTPVIFTVNPVAKVNLTALNVNPICQGQSAVISATTNASTAIQLFTVSTGGTSMGTFTSNSITVTPAPGTYTYYLQANNSTTGCNATLPRPAITLTVNALPIITITPTNSVICIGTSATLTANGASTYTWVSPSSNATSVVVTPGTSGVTYTVNGTTIGCTSQRTITINTNSPPTLTISGNSVVCSGNSTTLTALTANTYSWSNGTTSSLNVVSPTTNTIYTAVGTNTYATGNCTTSATFSINVDALPVVTAISSNTAICFGSNATITPGGANTYTLLNSGANIITNTIVSPLSTTTYTVGGTNTTTGCSNTETITLIVNNNPTLTTTVGGVMNVTCLGTPTGSISNTASGTSGYSYSWTPAVSATNTATGLGSGVYSATVTDVNGCSASVSNTIAAPSSSLSLSAATTTASCGSSNGSATLTPSGGWSSAYNYSWESSVSTSSISGGYAAGTYTVVVTDANGCSVTQTVNITNPNSPIINASSSIASICPGMNTTITPSGANSYSIVGLSVSSATVGISFIVNPASTEVYIVTGTDLSLCQSSPITVTVNVNPTPTIAIVLTNPSICLGQNSTLIPGGAATYTLLNTGQTITTNTIVSPTSTTEYTVNGTSALGCIGIPSTITLSLNALPVLTVTAQNLSICQGNSTDLYVNGATSYTWSTTETTSSITVSPFGNQMYSVIGIDAGTNCISSVTSITVAVNTLPNIITNTQNASGCEGENINLSIINPLSAPAKYVWSYNNTLGSSIVLSNVKVNESGIYSVTVTDSNGCINTNTVVLQVSNCGVTIPEIYSPNGDGKNDLFEIIGINNYPDNKLNIFNRWGNLVYQKEKYNNEWDGKPNVSNTLGKGLLPAGTYYVILDFGDGKTKTYTGFVQLEY